MASGKLGWAALLALIQASTCQVDPCQALAGRDGPKRQCDSRVDEGSSFVQQTLHSTRLGLDAEDASSSRRVVLTVTRFSCLVVSGDTSKGVPSTGNLSFIHIPRNAGTSIEECSKAAPEQERWGHENRALQGMDKNVTRCYLQHVPPAIKPKPYAGRDTFCVVRSPYERAISQLGFVTGFFPKKHSCNVTHLNSFLRTSLASVSGRPYGNDCHFLPQTAYVYGWDPKTKTVDRNGPQSCGRVLRHETLSQDFNRTMEERGLPYKLGQQRVSYTQSSKDCHKLSVQDLEEDVRRLIEEVYKDDFDLLGYARLPPTQ